jgi:chromosome segregation ATPase
MYTLFVAARQPLAIGVLLVALFTGLTVAIWMLPLGLLTYGVVVALAARDPQLAATAQRSAPRTRLSSKTFRALMKDIADAQHEVERSISQAEGPLSQLLQKVKDQTHELVNQAHVLAQKGQIIEDYLEEIDFQQLDANIHELDMKINRTTDGYILQQLEETRIALIKRQRHARDLQTFIKRIMAQLENIKANIDSVQAEIVRLRTADVVSADSSSNQVADHLRNLNADMSAFRQVLDTALQDSDVSMPPTT